MNQKPKILIFSLAFKPLSGGAEIALEEIVKKLSDSFSFDIITVMSNKNLPRKERYGAVNLYRVGFSSNQSENLQKENIFFKLNKIFFPIFALLKAISLNSKNKYKVFWSIMANHAGFTGLFFKTIFPKKKFILTIQEGDSLEHINKKVGILKPVYKNIFKKADYIQTISIFLKKFAKDCGAKVEPIVIPNGVSKIFFVEYEASVLKDFKAKMEFLPEDKIIITVSRLVEKNDIKDLIISLNNLQKEYKLLVLGTGPLADSLHNLSKENSLSNRVFFLGKVLYSEIPIYLKISDVFVRPSLSEGLGNSFLEAMASGVPIIGTNVGGIPDFLKNRETGLFCEVNNPKDISLKIREIMENDGLRKNLIENSKRIAFERYTWQKVSESFKKKIFNNINFN